MGDEIQAVDALSEITTATESLKIDEQNGNDATKSDKVKSELSSSIM